MLAADGLVVRGDTAVPSPGEKIENWGEMVTAGAGSYADMQSLRCQSEPPSNPWELGSCIRESEDDDMDSEYLAVYTNRVYHLDGAGAVVSVNTWDVIGCGGVNALALMEHLYDPDLSCAEWETFLTKTVLPCVSEVNIACGPPYTVKIFKT